MRHLPSPIALGPLLGLALASCSSHHTSDEVVEQVPDTETTDAGVEPSEPMEEEQPARPTQDAGGASSSMDAGSAAMQCNQTDVAARLICTAGLGGLGLEQIVNGFLGGGTPNMNCARETDPLALLLCTAVGGAGGLEGLVNGLLGDGGIGSILSDGGIERVITNALVEVTRGLIDDLLDALFGGFAEAGARTNRDAGARSTSRAPLLSAKSREPNALQRSAEECAAVTSADPITRLLCLRQALDQLPSSAP